MKTDLYEYVKEIITKNSFNFKENGVSGYLVDNERKAVIRRASVNEIYVELNDKYEGNFKKVLIEKLKANDWEAIKFTILLNKATKTYSVSIIVDSNGSIKVVNSDRKMYVLSFKDNKIVIHNNKAKTERFVDTNNINIDEIVEELSDLIKNAYIFSGWKKDVGELFDIIKPCIILGLNNIFDEWEHNIDMSIESIYSKIDDTDNQINKLREIREAYLSKISSLRISSDNLEKNKTR